MYHIPISYSLFEHMRCPKCGYEMISKKVDTSMGGNKSYDREQFVCNGDDIWVTVEIPQEEESETEEEK